MNTPTIQNVDESKKKSLPTISVDFVSVHSLESLAIIKGLEPFPLKIYSSEPPRELSLLNCVSLSGSLCITVLPSLLDAANLVVVRYTMPHNFTST